MIGTIWEESNILYGKNLNIIQTFLNIIQSMKNKLFF